MMQKVLPLVLLFSVLLLGMSFTQSSSAAIHPFELEWGISGTIDPGNFLYPQHVAVDSENNIYVTDLGNSRVQKFDDQGNFIGAWGANGRDAGQFGYPSGIAIADDHVFVVDKKLHKVQKFDTAGNFVTQWGDIGNGNGEFRSPNGITISEDKFVHVVDTGNSRIQTFTFDGEYVSQFGQSGKRAGNFVSPIDVAVDETGKFFVTDPGNKRINIYEPDGTFEKSIDQSVGGLSMYPEGIVFGAENSFYISDQRNNRIIEFNESGLPMSVFGVMGVNDGNFKFPKDVTIDNDGFLYVTDTEAHRIQKFSTPIVAKSLITEEQVPITDGKIEQSEPQTELEKISETEVESELVKPIPNDFKRPEIFVPDDIIIEASGGLTHVNIGEARANDESGILSLSNNSPESFPLGITTVIWTAIDGSGNMAIAPQTIFVEDTSSPEIEHLSDITLEAKSETQNLVKLTVPDTYDAVGIISLVNDAPEVFPLGETSVTWTATDVMGNLSTMQQKVILVDLTPPRVDIPEDIIIEATSINENQVSLIEPNIFDHVKVESLSSDAPLNFPLGETVVTWMVSDSSGNLATSSHKVVVIDSTAPEVSLSNITTEATIPNGSDISLPIPEINDIQDVEISNDAPEVFPFGETIVTWTVSDQSGNESTQIQSVNVIDTIDPVLIIPGDIEIEAAGINTSVEDLGELLVEDVSEIDSVTNDAPEVFPLGETIVTWTATDTSGNSASDTQLVTVVDTTAPQIIAPSSIIFEAVDPLENYIELSDERVFDMVEIQSVENDAPEVFPLGETIVTWTATDTSGNSASDTQVIIIEDTIQPEISGPENIVLEITGISGNIVDIGQATALDQVDVEPMISNDAPEFFPLGETIVTWTATDASGNFATFSQIISIIDSTAPELTSPVNIIQEAEDMASNSVILGDAQSSDIVGVLAIENDAPEFFPLGETIVTWTATDTSGNSISSTQLVTIVDTIAPSITAPESIIVEAISEQENVVVLENSIVEDISEIDSITNDAPEFFPLGETTVTWTATDTSGNSASDTQLVTVVDTTAPSIDNPASIVIEATGLHDNVVDLGMIITDDNVGVLAIENDAPEFFPLGETIVTWTAKDNAGNMATVQQEVSLVDTTVPSIALPSDIKVEAVSSDSNIIEIGDAIGSDIVEIDEITNDAPELFPLGETIVTWTATDTSGNSASDTQLVTVVDTTAPNITQLEDITVDATSATSNQIELVLPTVDDAISDVTITNDAPDVYPFGETVITWSAEDESGNLSYTNQKIIVVDNSPPELEVSGDIIIDGTSLENIIEIDLPQISDIIDTQPIITNDAPEFFPLGETIVTWTATDTSGNSISSTQLVSVQICGNAPSYYNMIMGTANDDFLTGTSLPDLIFAEGGDDIIIGNNGNDCIFAGEGNDIVFGNSGDDNIRGNQGNDIIKGNSGDDIIKGGVGLDVIDGGDDIDTCIVIEEQNSDIVIKCEANA